MARRLWRTVPSKPHHQAGKDHRKPAKAITTKHDPTMAALANASKMERVRHHFYAVCVWCVLQLT
jgi:hypothetical protein